MSSSTAAPKKKGKETPILTEIDRQKTVLSELPDDYQFPLFDGRQAIESQRKSGYKTTARAAREIIDNALEAGAKNVWIVLKRPAESERSKGERRDAVSAVAFIDDGPGMGYTEDAAGSRCVMKRVDGVSFAQSYLCAAWRTSKRKSARPTSVTVLTL